MPVRRNSRTIHRRAVPGRCHTHHLRLSLAFRRGFRPTHPAKSHPNSGFRHPRSARPNMSRRQSRQTCPRTPPHQSAGLPHCDSYHSGTASMAVHQVTRRETPLAGHLAPTVSRRPGPLALPPAVRGMHARMHACTNARLYDLPIFLPSPSKMRDPPARHPRRLLSPRGGNECSFAAGRRKWSA
jgi:hypothetical protein